MSTQIVNPFEFFTDRSGTPVDGGFIFIGVVNTNPETNPVQVFWDEDLVIPAAQPIRTVSGYPARNGTPSQFFIAENDYSITVKESTGELVFNSLSAKAIPTVGSDLAKLTLASVSDLVNTATSGSLAYMVAAYQPGAFALARPYDDNGGGMFRWDAARSTLDHDGGTIIDPNRPFPSDWDDDAQVSAWFTAVGSGSGCFVRQGTGEISVEMYGARHSLTPVKNTQSFQKALAYVGPDHLLEPSGRRTVHFGAGRHLITATLDLAAFQTLKGPGHDGVLVFDHAAKALKVGDGDTGGTSAASAQLQDFCVQKKGPSEPQYPTQIVAVEGNSVNVKIKNVFFDAVFATDSIITNRSSYGLTLEDTQIRYCRADAAHINLLNLANETNYSYAVRLINCDITGVTKIDGTYWKAIKQAGGQLSLKNTVVQDTGTAIECGDGTQTFPILDLDYVFFEANRDFHINCAGTGNNKPLVTMKACRLNHGLGGNVYLAGAEIFITGTQETGTSNWTGDATSHTTRAQVTLGPGNGLILPSDFSVTRGLTMRMAPPTSQDLAGGAGTPFEIYGVNINNSRHSVIQVTHINGTGNATTSETFMIRHGADSGNFGSVSMGRQVGAGGSAGTWTFTANADGRLFCQFSAVGTWRYTVVSTG